MLLVSEKYTTSQYIDIFFTSSTNIWYSLDYYWECSTIFDMMFAHWNLQELAGLAPGFRWNLVMQYWAKVRWSPPSTLAQTCWRIPNSKKWDILIWVCSIGGHVWMVEILLKTYFVRWLKKTEALCAGLMFPVIAEVRVEVVLGTQESQYHLQSPEGVCKQGHWVDTGNSFLLCCII